MRGAFFHHAQHGGENAAYGADLTTIPVARGRHGELMSEQLVCAVNQMNFHQCLFNSSNEFRKPVWKK
jgi:hypothetical protein